MSDIFGEYSSSIYENNQLQNSIFSPFLKFMLYIQVF